MEKLPSLIVSFGMENTSKNSLISALNCGLLDIELQSIENLYQAFNTGDPDLLDYALAVDWIDSPMAPGQQPGRQGMKPMVMAFRAAFKDLNLDPREVIGFGGRAAVRLTLKGRHVGEWMGVPGTGRSFTIAMNEFHHFRDGRITHTWHLEDWANWREQVGGQK